jgi:hypothetical protein
VVAALTKAGVWHAVGGDQALGIRGVTTSRHGLEFAVVAIPAAELAAAGFVVQGELATREGVKVRLRVVRPAVLARAERFGKLAVLGAADLLRGKIEDACAPGVLPAIRAGRIEPRAAGRRRGAWRGGEAGELRGNRAGERAGDKGTRDLHVNSYARCWCKSRQPSRSPSRTTASPSPC